MGRKKVIGVAVVALVVLMSQFGKCGMVDVDAFEWVNWSYEEKRIFVRGFLHAQKEIDRSLAGYVDRIPDEEVKADIKRAVQALALGGDKYPQHVVDSMETFYAKASNTSVPAGRACAIVLQSMR